MSDSTTDASIDSRISCWSDEEEMGPLERVKHRDYLIRMELDLQGCPEFTVKVSLILMILSAVIIQSFVFFRIRP